MVATHEGSLLRALCRWLMVVFYLLAGVAHLLRPEPFLAITPPWVPMPEFMVAFTGIAEILGAIGLIIPRFRRAAGIGLALYALCVWPANIYHALANVAVGGETMTWGYHGPRLLAQPLIILWALWVGGVFDKRQDT